MSRGGISLDWPAMARPDVLAHNLSRSSCWVVVVGYGHAENEKAVWHLRANERRHKLKSVWNVGGDRAPAANIHLPPTSAPREYYSCYGDRAQD